VLQEHLLDQLIPALVGRRRPPSDDPRHRRPRQDYRPETLRDGLRLLANVMAHMPHVDFHTQRHRPEDDGTPTRDFRWWYLPELVLPPWLLPTVHVVTAVVLGAILGAFQGAAATGEMATTLGEAGSKTVAGAAGLAMAGLFIGGWQALSANKAVSRPPRLTAGIGWTPPRTSSQRRRFTRILALWLGGLFAAYLASYALLWLTAKIWDGVAGAAPQWFSRASLADLRGPAVLVVTALVGTALQWRNQTASLRETGTPASTLRAEFSAAALRLTLFALSGAFVIGVVTAAGLSSDLVVYNTFTISFLVLTAGLLTGPRLWLGHLTSALVITASTRARTPIRLMTFLEDAHRLGLLRPAGPAYQFRHSDLQDHLSARYRQWLAEQQAGAKTEPVPGPARRSLWARAVGHPVSVGLGWAGVGVGIVSLYSLGGIAAVLARVLALLTLVALILWWLIQRRR
jgi:hypothetical protein